MTVHSNQTASNGNSNVSHTGGYQQHRRSYQNYSNRFSADPSRQNSQFPSGHGHMSNHRFDNNYNGNGFWNSRRQTRQQEEEDKSTLHMKPAEDDRDDRRSDLGGKASVQSPIGPAPRLQTQSAQQTRMPYSAALLGIGTSPTRTAIVALPKIEKEGSSPISQTMEMPPTPALTSSQERSEESEAEMEAKKEIKSGIESVQASQVANVPHMDQAIPRHQSERRVLPTREYDPYGVFVSRFPDMDNLETCLANFFGDCAVKSIRVQMGKGPGAHKFAFVDFYDTDSTQRALNRHEALFFGMTLNVKPKGMPNHTYLNRGHGQTRPQQGPYKTILGHHEEAEGILKAACGLAPPVAPSEASNATACHHDSRALSSSPHKLKGSALPKNPLRGNIGKKGDINAYANQPFLQVQQTYYEDNGSQVQSYDGYYPCAPMYWQCPPLSPDQILMQPTTASNSPEQPMQIVHTEVSGGSASPISPSAQDGICTDNPPKCQLQGGQPMPYLPQPFYDPTAAAEGRIVSCLPFTPSMPMGAEMGGTHWPIVTMDPSGQQYMVQPYGGMYYPTTAMMNSQHHVRESESKAEAAQAGKDVNVNAQQYHQGPPFPSPHHFASNGQMNPANAVPMMSMPFNRMPFPQPVYSMPMQYNPASLAYGPPTQMMPGQGVAMSAPVQMKSWNTDKVNGQATTNIGGDLKQDVFGELGADNKPISIPAWMNDCY